MKIRANHLHSTYDTHSDGSGVCYSSWRRPLLNLRPTYRARGVGHNGAAHQLAADLYLVDWLYEQGTGVEFVTDVELHTEGAESLRPYRVVISGSHPEYTSRPMVEGLRDYLGSGGRFMYLGGNGSYWVTDFDAERGHTVEVRRWGPATRTWDARPGEWYLSFNGELGGLWRHRGLPSQRWLGVGTTAAGCGETRPYTRTQRSYEPDVSWVFDGVASPHVGDDVECLTYPGGAAGFEMDRFDPALGSPRTTILLASATGFEPSYHKLIDDILNISAAVLEDPDQRYVRADMVLVPYPNGGCVFSVGAITWTACLSSNNYKNSVSVVTNNVVDALRALEGELDGTA